MKKYLFFFIFSFFVSFANQIYIYEETTAGKVSTITWYVKEEKKEITFLGEDDFSTTILKGSKDYDFTRFYYKDKNTPTEYFLSLEGKDLLVDGKIDDTPISKKHKIKLAWIQQFGFGFKNFALSKVPMIKFCLINPQNFSLQNMVATKKGIENLTVNDQNYEAIKLVATLPGLKSIFWKATLWFDSKTGDLLKYTANKGPKTPMTTIVLKSIKKEGSFDKKIEKSFSKLPKS